MFRQVIRVAMTHNGRPIFHGTLRIQEEVYTSPSMLSSLRSDLSRMASYAAGNGRHLTLTVEEEEYNQVSPSVPEVEASKHSVPNQSNTDNEQSATTTAAKPVKKAAAKTAVAKEKKASKKAGSKGGKKGKAQKELL